VENIKNSKTNNMAESKSDSTRMDLDLQAVEAMLLATQSQRQRFEPEFEATGKD